MKHINRIIIKAGIAFLAVLLFMIPSQVKAEALETETAVEIKAEAETEEERETKEVENEKENGNEKEEKITFQSSEINETYAVTDSVAEIQSEANAEEETNIKSDIEEVSEHENGSDAEINSEHQSEPELATKNSTDSAIQSEKELETYSETEPEQEPGTEISMEIIKAWDLDLGEYEAEMIVGSKQLLSVTVLPMTATNTTVIYCTSDPNILQVNGLGRITAVGVGRASITIIADEIRRDIEIEVTEEKDTSVHVTDIEIGEYETELEVGKTVTISGKILPSNATETEIIYSSSDSSVATVSSTGEVRGISKGNVTITLSADGFSKNVPLTVKVATAGIALNEDYLVLKNDESYQLSAKVTPAEASQTVTYHSADSEIATVSPEGLVTAVGRGSTTILVSNEDTSVAVSVIVNEPVQHEASKERTAQNTENKTKSKKVYEDKVLASEQQIIDSEMLSYFYETKQLLTIIGEGYIIEIDGKDIVNYKNEFYTDISLVRENGSLSFILNDGKELCGEITLYIEETEGKYLYLYNESRKRYERIGTKTVEKINLTTAGGYRLQDTKLETDMTIIIYIVIAGVILLLIGTVIYIVIKRKYWFW